MNTEILHRILFVDDEPAMLELVEVVLEEDGFTVEACSSGEEALEKVAAFKPDLILLDMQMPGMDGPATLKALRRLPATSATPVIFISAAVEAYELARIKAMGGLDVIAKPFDPASLASRINAIWGNQPGSHADNVQAQLQTLRASYAEHLPARIGEIRKMWEICRGDPLPENIRTMHRFAHNLAGSGATFGYAALSEAARVMEACLKDVQLHGHTLDSVGIKRLAECLAAVESAALVQGSNVQNVIQPVPRELGTSAGNRLVYLVEDDAHLAQDLILQMQNFGYDVKWFANTEAAKAQLKQEQPAAVVMDIMFPRDMQAGTTMIGELKRAGAVLPPVIYISMRDDFAARLAAVRAESAGYFTKPVDLMAMIDLLDRLTMHRVEEPYRILIVDDDAELAEQYTLTLRQAGMEVMKLSHPLEIMLPLAEFKPDLVLMDLYMPVCDGLELAAVIRQQPRYDSVPIVFLTTEDDIGMRMRAMGLGADDFLHKPIALDQLIANISTRARRARVLRAHMVLDGLTGLHNHSTTKDHLQRELARARRRGTPMALGIIDLDHFKSINDIYGHATGDRVIKTLATLLQQRLRMSDFVGRVGGEEFAVIFSDTSAATAVRVIDKIRDGFAQVRHYFGTQEFNISFSCGIAVMENFDDAATLYEAADQALYRAKHDGRNRVMTAEGRTAGGGQS